MSTAVAIVDDFAALEQKVQQAIDIVKREREARAAAEAESASLREQLQAARAAATGVEAQVASLSAEREHVRERVEKMLQQMDDLL